MRSLLLATLVVTALASETDPAVEAGRRHLEQARASRAAGLLPTAERHFQLALIAPLPDAELAEARVGLTAVREALEKLRVQGEPVTPLDRARRIASELLAGTEPGAVHRSALEELARLAPQDPVLLQVRAQVLPPWAETVGQDDHGRWAACRIGRILIRFRGIPPGRLVTNSGRILLNAHPFWIGETEVTEDQWVAICKDPDRGRGLGLALLGIPTCQIEAGVDCFAAQVTGGIGRLPTADEWEWAARAGATGAFRPEFRSFQDGNYDATDPEPAGTHTPNAWGLYDVHGSAWELCRQPDGHLFRRGGSWRSRRAACTLDRAWPLPDGTSEAASDPTLGFRLLIAPHREG